ncbi:MAG: hypothetical protein ACRCSK_01495 [Fusobacteriaceae bacterium]
MKLALKIIALIFGGIIIILLLTFLFKNQIIKFVLSQNGIETKSVSLMLNDKKLELEGIKYKGFTVSSIKIQATSFSFGEVNIKDINIENFSPPSNDEQKKDTKNNSSSKQNNNSQRSALSIGEKFDAAETILRSGISLSKNILTGFVENQSNSGTTKKNISSLIATLNNKSNISVDKKVVEAELKARAKKINLNSIIDVAKIDREVTSSIERALEPEIYKQVISYRNASLNVKNKIVQEKNGSDDSYIINIENLYITSNIFGIPLQGNASNISTKFSSIKDNIKVFLTEPSTKNNISVNLNPANFDGTANIDLKGVQLKIIPEVSKYISAGNLSLNQATTFSNGEITFNGTLNFYNVKINAEVLANEILKGGSTKIYTRTILVQLLKKINGLNSKYTYDSKTRKFVLKTNLYDILQKIIKEDGQQIIGKLVDENF